MEMERKNIYGTNNSQVMYTFRIIEETETHYKTYDVDYPQWKLNFEKDTLKCTSDDKIVEKVVNEGLFVSFDLDEVKKEYLNRSIAISENSLSKYLKEYNDFKEYLEKVYNNDFSYKTYSNVNLDKLDFRQKVIFVTENDEFHEGFVGGFFTTDKIHFDPIFEFHANNTNYVMSSKNIKKTDKGYYVINFVEYDKDDNEEYEFDAKVFFNYDDYYNYAYNIQLEKDISKLNGYKNKVKETERNIQKMKNQL
jgi:hypothetical protein